MILDLVSLCVVGNLCHDIFLALDAHRDRLHVLDLDEVGLVLYLLVGHVLSVGVAVQVVGSGLRSCQSPDRPPSSGVLPGVPSGAHGLELLVGHQNMTRYFARTVTGAGTGGTAIDERSGLAEPAG